MRAAGGVDVILDMVGKPYFDKNLTILKDLGRLCYIAFLQGSKVEGDARPAQRLPGSLSRPGRHRGRSASLPRASPPRRGGARNFSPQPASTGLRALSCRQIALFGALVRLAGLRSGGLARRYGARDVQRSVPTACVLPSKAKRTVAPSSAPGVAVAATTVGVRCVLGSAVAGVLPRLGLRAHGDGPRRHAGVPMSPSLTTIVQQPPAYAVVVFSRRRTASRRARGRELITASPLASGCCPRRWSSTPGCYYLRELLGRFARCARWRDSPPRSAPPAVGGDFLPRAWRAGARRSVLPKHAAPNGRCRWTPAGQA